MIGRWSSLLARFVRGSALGVVLTACGLAAAVFVEACATESDATGGKRVVLRTRIEADPAAAEQSENAFGWKVTLNKVLVASGPLYYFDSAPPFAQMRRPRPIDSEFAERALGLVTAHAHPGHYQEGDALGQMLESATIDLLAAPMSLPDGDGITGTYRSARFSFATPRSGATGAVAAELGAHVALAVGQAEKDGETVRFFRAKADVEDIEKSAAQGHVEGCEFEEVHVGGDGTVKILVRPQIWFELVDFGELDAGAADEPSEFPDGSQPAIAFAQGLAQLSAYQFSFEAR